MMDFDSEDELEVSSGGNPAAAAAAAAAPAPTAAADDDSDDDFLNDDPLGLSTQEPVAATLSTSPAGAASEAIENILLGRDPAAALERATASATVAAAAAAAASSNSSGEESTAAAAAAAAAVVKKGKLKRRERAQMLKTQDIIRNRGLIAKGDMSDDEFANMTEDGTVVKDKSPYIKPGYLMWHRKFPCRIIPDD
eukprot:19855-Heterococcus_DN1.PRE.3